MFVIIGYVLIVGCILGGYIAAWLAPANKLRLSVIEDGARERVVILPGEGEWVHAFTGEAFPAGTHTIAAPIGCPPVFYNPHSDHAELFAGLRHL